jgi:hypothetical protein
MLVNATDAHDETHRSSISLGPTKSNGCYRLQRRGNLPSSGKLSPTPHNFTSRPRARIPIRERRPQPIGARHSTLAILAPSPGALLAVRSDGKKHTYNRSGPPTQREPDIPHGCRSINKTPRPGFLIFFRLHLPRAATPRFEACGEKSEAAGEVCLEPIPSFLPRRFT